MVLSMNRYGSCKVITISAQEGWSQTAVLLTTPPPTVEHPGMLILDEYWPSLWERNCKPL